MMRFEDFLLWLDMVTYEEWTETRRPRKTPVWLWEFGRLFHAPKLEDYDRFYKEWYAEYARLRNRGILREISDESAQDVALQTELEFGVFTLSVGHPHRKESP